MTPDPELLRAFAESGDEAAFAALVNRRIDFVYACALRQLGGDAHRASDVVQEVFVKLARHARSLSRHPALLGWLCTTTRFVSLDAIRTEHRRRLRENEAQAMHHQEHGQQADWEKLRPVLDGALTELTELDRELVLARHFERHSYGEISRTFGLSENAAQKRVDRALDKLRIALTRHQITSTSSALGLALGNLPSAAAPAGLSASVVESALLAAAAGAPIGTAATFLFMSTSKFTLAATGLATVLCIGSAVLGVRAEQRASARLHDSQRELAALREQATELEQRARDTEQQVAMANDENTRLLAAAETTRQIALSPPREEPITSAIVSERVRLAQQLVLNGDPAEALRLLIWCYDVGMTRFSSMSAARTTLLLTFGRLGERYPPALDFLRVRREEVRSRYYSDTGDTDRLSELSALNRALKDDAANVALLDQIPAGDRRRRTLLVATTDHLIELQRYKDAAEGRSYSSISSMFEVMIHERPLPPESVDPQAARRKQREAVVKMTVNNIELLAGSGEVANARKLAERLLSYDNSATTRALIERHSARAGQPELLAQPTTP